MTPWQQRTTELTSRMAGDMKVRNLAQSTIDCYTYHVGRFAQFLEGTVAEATPEDVRSFQLHMIEERKVGWSSFNQAVCGLRFLYTTIVYLHVRRPHLGSTPSPIDWLPVRQLPGWQQAPHNRNDGPRNQDNPRRD